MPGSTRTTGKAYTVKEPQEHPNMASLSSLLSITEACKRRRDQDIKAYAEFVVDAIKETLASHVDTILQRMEEERIQRECAEENRTTEAAMEEDMDTQEVIQLNEIVEQFLNPDFACDIPLAGRLTASPTPSFKVEE
jgi:hypothetical protein